MEYKVITATSESGLNNTVNSMIKEGWKPKGSHSVVRTHEQKRFTGMQHKYTTYQYEYSQTMIKNVKHKISYNGNEHETYDLLLNGTIVAELLVGEDGASKIVSKIDTFLSARQYSTDQILAIQNDGDKLGVIVDIYDGEDWQDGTTFWFDDFIDK